MNKKAFVDTVLNNGSLPADGFIPVDFAKSSDGKRLPKGKWKISKR